MADGSKFRLVRCPKCDNLLPENPNYSVYQCGGCGAVLKAKKKAEVNHSSAEKSDEEISRDKTETLEYLSEKGNSSLGSTSDGTMESSRVEQNNRKGIVFGYRTIDFPHISSESENRKDTEGLGLDPNDPRKDSKYLNEDDHSSNLRVNDWVRRHNLRESSESENLSIEKDTQMVHNSGNGYSNFAGKSRVAYDRTYYGYPDGGSSSNASDGHYGYGENVWNNGFPLKPTSWPNLEHDPAEIMRTIDELKDRLSRYCGTVEKPRFDNDRVFPDRYYYDKVSQTHENFYPARREDQFPLQMNMQPFDQSSSYMYRTQMSREYDLGRRIDSREFHTPMNHWASHHSGCACLDCVTQLKPQTLLNPRDMLSGNLNRYSSPLPPRTPGRDSTPLGELMARERWGSEPESDNDIISGQRRQVMTRKNEQYCRSISGGAPFIACYNCFELLKLPKNLIKGKNKVKCGACSFIIGVKIEKNRLIIGNPKGSDLQSSEVNENSSYRSDDFVDLGNKSHDFKTSELNSMVEVRESKSNLGEKKPSFSSSEGEEERPSHFTIQQNTPNSAEAVLSSKKSALSLDDRSDCSSEHVGDQNAIQSNRARNVLLKIQSLQDSAEDVSESSELELEDSFDEYPNTQTSQESTEIDKEEDQTKYGNGDEIILADRVEKQNVLVNGHLIPDHLVKKAENLAGTILPGDYWYDYQAGFWGVIGHPCLGIIPPFIPEFNYPMPPNCAAGNSGVYINGRELNQNDLDLLSGRGLPTTRDRFYILNISGRVRDEDSGEELYNLGKLAPTIEKMKRGFGMKVPRLLK